MTARDLVEMAALLTRTSPGNRISAQQAVSPGLEGLELFTAPISAVASADDPMFDALKEPQAIGAHHRSPREWLPGARCVLSLFFPFTPAVREANRAQGAPADEWLHGRYEGQKFIDEALAALVGAVKSAGGRAVAPSVDGRFREEAPPFSSTWSERHVAYVAGLGTFGLSKNLITKRGAAGRLGSLVSTMAWEPTPRPYDDLYAYCAFCGACVRRCPVRAISIRDGKRHPPCDDYLDEVRARAAPRYGCGKCQTRVPCEERIPSHSRSL